jgi:CRISPR-associated protein Csm5
VNRYSLRIVILSPVHIGCGTDYDPLGYVIDGNENELCSFTPGDLASVLDPEEFGHLEEISEMPGASGLNEMRRFIGQHVQSIREVASHRVQVAAGISNEYGNAIGGGRRSPGQLEIARTFHNPISNDPIIPGSSIKGAIRTAVLSALNDGDERPDKRNYARDLLGGIFSEDPFRLVKIADASHQKVEGAKLAKIVYAVNKYRAPDGDLLSGKGITVRLETIRCFYEAEYSFYSSLNLTQLGNVRGKTPRNDLRWGFSQIGKMCNDFYRPKLEKDLQTLGGQNDDWVRWVKQKVLEDKTVGPRLGANNAFILRVGHHSGAESVTMDGARSIMIRRGRGQTSYEKQATTQWFTADKPDSSIGLLPFGWMLVLVNKAA